MRRHYVALLRAINVGGHTVKMDRLKALFIALGLERVETFIASGNVLFDTASKSRATLTKAIEAHLHQQLGYEVATFLRTGAELAETLAHLPFGATDVAQAHTVYVGFMNAALTVAQTKDLAALATPVDAFHARGREVYWLCRVSSLESRFSGATFERIFKRPSTWRNLNTVKRLAEKMG
jgi:uncharacterized protein (DUF1697 family)